MVTADVKLGRPKVWTQAVIEGLAKNLDKWFDEKPERFWLKDFAIEHGFDPQRMSEWATRSHVDYNEAFSEALKKARLQQESRLVNMGGSGAMALPMAIFALKCNHGWNEKVIVENTGTVNVRDVTTEDLQNAGAKEILAARNVALADAGRSDDSHGDAESDHLR